MRGLPSLCALLLWLAAAPALVAQGAVFTYDANGNLTSRTENGVVWTYTYDARDLLREVQRDGLLLESYQYDHQGHRIKKAGLDGVVRYVWDENRIILETDDHGNTIAKYDYAGDRLLAVHHATEGTAYYLLDGLGSPVGLMRPDGSVAARYRLDAWGVLRTEAGDSSNPFRFTGHLFDEATGLYYAKARYYDPELGRFLSEDPLAGSVDDPPSLHPYLYAHANPTVFTDPDGRRAATDEDRHALRQLFVTETQLKREYAESRTYRGKPITQEQYDHALVDLRVRQQSYVHAVMEAHEGERVATHPEQAAFDDRRGVMRYRPVPSQERWERETQENARELFLYIEGPNMVASLLAGASAPRAGGRPTNAGQMPQTGTRRRKGSGRAPWPSGSRGWSGQSRRREYSGEHHFRGPWVKPRSQEELRSHGLANCEQQSECDRRDAAHSTQAARRDQAVRCHP